MPVAVDCARGAAALRADPPCVQCTAVHFACRHEKYDVTGIGSTGSGGEYTPQVGFGWTNGVALDLITRYNFTTLDF